MLGVNSVGLADPIGLAHAGTNPNVYYSALNAGAAFFGNVGTNQGGTALRQNNSIKYVTPVMSGFIGAAMYGFGEKAGDDSASSYAALSGTFTDGKSGVSVAYAKLKHATDGSELTLLGGGAKYVMSALTFKATYVQSETGTSTTLMNYSPTVTALQGINISDRKVAVTGLGVDYALTPAITLTGAYYNTKQSGTKLVIGKADLSNGKTDQYIAMGKYALSKRTVAYASLTYAEAGSAAIKDTMMSSGLVAAGQSDATRFAVGVMHSF